MKSFFDTSDFRKNFLTNKRGDMDRDEMEELRRMVQEEQYEQAFFLCVRNMELSIYLANNKSKPPK